MRKRKYQQLHTQVNSHARADQTPMHGLIGCPCISKEGAKAYVCWALMHELLEQPCVN